jgi:hypothetical protein
LTRLYYLILVYYIVGVRYWKIHNKIFSISSLVKISITWLLVFIQFFAWDYIINRTLHSGLKIWLFSSRVKNNILLMHSLRSFVKYCFHHSKIKVISSRRRVISSIYQYETILIFYSLHNAIDLFNLHISRTKKDKLEKVVQWTYFTVLHVLSA